MLRYVEKVACFSALTSILLVLPIIVDISGCDEITQALIVIITYLSIILCFYLAVYYLYVIIKELIKE